MTNTRVFALCAIALRIAAAPAEAQEQAEEGEWIQLFNGKDIDDWNIKIRGHALNENFGNTFRVEDGILKVSYDQYDKFDDQFGHIFYKEEFSSYRLRVEYRFVGEQIEGGAGWATRNSGLMIHGQSAESMELDQKFPTSIEVQLLGGDGAKERTTMNLCTPGTNVVMDGELILKHCNSSTSKTYHGEQWVTVEVEVIDNTITHIAEGEVVLAYTDPQLDETKEDAQRLLAAGHDKMLTGGTISLQSESHPVEFRKVELMKLD